MPSPYSLFSNTKIAGSFSTTAMFIASKVVPWLEPPSPVNDTATLPVPSVFAVSAAPTTSGGPPPTMPLAPSMPWSRSAMCIEPPLPPHSPPSLANSSCIMPATSQPLAMLWPCPRCVLAM